MDDLQPMQITVAETCRQYGISWRSFYVYHPTLVSVANAKGLFAVEGVAVVGASLPGQGSRSLEDEGSYTPHPKDLDVPDATGQAGFACADLTTFCRLDELRLEVTAQRLAPDRAVLACRIADEDRWCRRCGEEGSPRDSVTRTLAHEPEKVASGGQVQVSGFGQVKGTTARGAYFYGHQRILQPGH